MNAADKFGRTALMSTYRVAVAELLLAAGADVHAVGSGGYTPLHLAPRGDEGAAVARLLLAHGAAPDAVDEKGGTPLMRAADTEDGEETVQLLPSAE
ncbi:MAG: ankyrin repeat domain-containing protein [Deltaproteobacteria bacterium]|nr:ankyrin repeat domain-containing protein [Deltaproteobacteria bacterium]